jgi:pimeloyl-ACP methyl ester carboxylesterase
MLMGTAGKFWKTLLAGSAGMAALAAVNATIRRNASEPDESALGGEPQTFQWRHGRVFYKTSSFMWRKNFDALAADFRVYALDLLGFGFSDKPANAPYSADLYVELIADFIREITGPVINGQGARVVASSLGAAYCVRVADEHPELISALVCVAPTGADYLRARPGMTGAAFYGLLQSPVLGTSFHNVMTSERSIRDYARTQLFYNPARVTPRLVAQYYANSHQPGAQNALTAFLSGYLNTDTREAFARLKQPLTLVWGKQDQTNPIEEAVELLRLNSRTRLEIFDPCRMMPQEEDPERFNALVRAAFLSRSAAA